MCVTGNGNARGERVDKETAGKIAGLYDQASAAYARIAAEKISCFSPEYPGIIRGAEQAMARARELEEFAELADAIASGCGE
jgi:hypothetical protein